MQQRRFNILVSSAGRRVVLLRLLREALDEVGIEGSVVAVDSQRASSAFQMADESFLVPPCTDGDFLPVVLDVCRRKEIRLVVPTIDLELATWASVRDACHEREGMTVAVSSPKVIEIAADKAETNGWLRDNGFPATHQLSHDRFGEPGSGQFFPVVVKPRRGSSSNGVTVARDLDTLRAVAAPDDVIEALAPGTEYTIDVLVGRDGRTRCAVPRRRVEVRGGEVSKAVVERRRDLMALASDIGDALPGAYGVLNIQVMRDDDTGDCQVIEINPRFGGGFPLTSVAGGRFPTWLIEEILELPSSQPRAAWKDGMAMLRYDEAVYVDAGAADSTVHDMADRRCVVFDLDDTLFLERDYVRSGFAAVGHWAQSELGVAGLTDHCWTLFEQGHRGRIFDEALEACGFPPTPELVAELVGVYREHPPAIRLLPDARACIAGLRRRGDILAVVSDGPLPAQQRKAEALGVRSWAQVVVFTDAFGPGFGKPHCRAFAAVEAQSGLRGSSCTYVADNTAKDFAGPKALDWRTVRVRRPHGLHHAAPSPVEVDAEMHDLFGLERWFAPGRGARP